MIDLVGHTLTAGGKPVARKNKDRNILYTQDDISNYFVIGIRYIDVFFHTNKLYEWWAERYPQDSDFFKYSKIVRLLVKPR